MEDKYSNPLESLSDIKQLMERSSRFISLSGLSGVFAGLYALAGAGIGYWYMNNTMGMTYRNIIKSDAIGNDFVRFFAIDAGTVLLLALTTGVYLTTRSAKRNNQSIWDKTAQRLLINMMIPLSAGALFCISLLINHLYGLIPPVMLLFYGMALINASKYTLGDVRYLGICQVILGLIASFFIGHGLLFWSIGFGILHIVYGVVMYIKYER